MLTTPVSSSTTAQGDDDVVTMRERRRKRLKAIIISRLKDARDVFETREALLRSWKTGGMEFTPEQAERVVKEIERAKRELEEELKRLRSELRDEERREGERAFEQIFTAHMADLSEPELPAAEKEELLESGLASHEPETMSEEQPVIHSAHSVKLNVRNTDDGTNARPRVDSVVTPQTSFAKHHPMGPIDELARMTIEDFRKLGAPTDAAQKIIEKVSLLAVDSLLEQKKAIDAWKQSEVYQVYLALGTESLEKRVAINDVIKSRKKRGLPTLTLEEFNQVAEVNRKISFSR